MAWMLASCAEPQKESSASIPTETGSTSPSHPLPEHSECRPGEVMDDATCLAVIEEDGRLPGQSYDKSDMPQDPDDPRLTDADFLWLTAEFRSCTCSCCHQSSLGGPGAYFLDLDFEPVWVDSASDWSLEVFAGIRYDETQRLPSSDPERLVRIVEEELARRDR